MGKLINGIHHVALKCKGVEEFQKTIHFYKDILGLDVARTWGSGTDAGIMLDTGCGILEIFASAEEDLPQGAIRHFALLTEGFEWVSVKKYIFIIICVISRRLRSRD